MCLRSHLRGKIRIIKGADADTHGACKKKTGHIPKKANRYRTMSKVNAVFNTPFFLH